MNLWKFLIRFSFVVQKQKQRERKIEQLWVLCWVLLHHLLRFLSTGACDNSCYCSNFLPLFGFDYCWCYISVLSLPLAHFRKFNTVCCMAVYHTDVFVYFFIVCIFECRWRDDILALLLPYLTCLVMHILNSVQSIHTQCTNEWIFPRFPIEPVALFFICLEMWAASYSKRAIFSLFEWKTNRNEETIAATSSEKPSHIKSKQ